MTMRIIMWTLKLLVLYSKSIAGRGVAGLISWLGTAGLVDCFNKSMSDCYIRVYRSFWQGTANFWLGLLLATPLKQGTQLIFKILEVYCMCVTLVNWNIVSMYSIQL